jgi:predicted nucleic acid-binding protein
MPIQLFVDTNILLSFYHYAKDELVEIQKLILLIKNKRIILFITQQVVDEFRRNREAKLNDALKQINEKFKFGDYPPFCRGFAAYKELDQTIKKAQSLHKELIDHTKSKIQDNNLQADMIIAELFHAAEILPVTESIYNKAKQRIDKGNPPGKDRSYGDAINWEIILEKSEDFYDLYIVADDKDYYSLLSPHKINPFLEIEYSENTIGNISCYRSLTSFFKDKFPEINFEVEQTKDNIIHAIVESSNFASTHKAVNRLSLYETYSKEQIEQVLDAAFSNTQIYWILGDSDIKNQIWSLYDKNKTRLNKTTVETFLKKWKEKFPTDQNEEDSNEVPF